MSDLLDSHARRRDVPKLKGSRAGVCISCARWAAFPPRFRKCFACQPSESARQRLVATVAALEAANVQAPKPAKPKDQRTVAGIPLGRATALVAALAKDMPNLRACDLKPEFRDLWPA